MEPIRLDKRLSALLGIPRGEARRYIEGGWVTVNGEVVEQPQRPVDEAAQIVVAEQASDEKAERVSMLLHKPAGVAAETLCALVSSDSRSELDASGVRPLQRHFNGLQLAASLPASDSGLVVVSHYLEVAVRYADHVLFLDREGQIALHGPPDEVFADGSFLARYGDHARTALEVS